MHIYLVGGAVRDQLLNREVTERDYVVVGSSPQQLLDLGYQAVGKDFPVFLHPETKEEYALARTEKKAGLGYHGFEFYTSTEVTLEQDLKRRDLTINAIAIDPNNGQLIDPYHGQKDLEDRVLRHVSEAFVEDPLRVLRVARFAARYYDYGFKIAKETLTLMREISHSNELQALNAERVWKETVRALAEPHAEVYIQSLADCGALAVLFPEIDALFGVAQPEQYHPEIDTGVHTLMALQRACQHGFDPIVRWAVLVHDLGKALTPKDQLPKHILHEKRGIPVVEAICQRLKVPAEFKKLALLVCEYHLQCHQVMTLRPQTLLKLLKQLGALRQTTSLTFFCQSCLCDAQGRLGLEQSEYPQADYLTAASEIVRSVSMKDIPPELSGIAIAEEMDRIRLKRLKLFKANY